MKSRAESQQGLTVLEVFFALVVVALLALFLPALTHGNRRVRRDPIVCVNNLKQLGLAYRLWAGDHDDQFPFASPNANGSLAFANSPQVFRHYQVMSNDLVNPKILVCPADPKRLKAIDFASLSNTNVSYFVGLDAREDYPDSVLSGDRNITGGTLSDGFRRVLTPKTEAGWTPEIHVRAGNIGLGDGSVQQMNDTRLRQHLGSMTNAVIRLAIP